ncbi:MAG: DinB family protein [Phycisphaerales bacterium]
MSWGTVTLSDPGRSSDCVIAAVMLLDQASALIAGLDDRAFASPSSRIAGGTIGKHFRHCLDHFAAVAQTLIDGSPIDYDHRDRDVPMETDRRAALDRFSAVRRALLEILPAHVDRPVCVRVMLTGDGHEADFRSTLGREIAFAAHHAVHHHAMIRSIADEFGFTSPPEFGKAPSTINFESR